MFLLGFGIGAVVGGTVGIAIMCMMQVSGRCGDLKHAEGNILHNESKNQG